MDPTNIVNFILLTKYMACRLFYENLKNML